MTDPSSERPPPQPLDYSNTAEESSAITWAFAALLCGLAAAAVSVIRFSHMESFLMMLALAFSFLTVTSMYIASVKPGRKGLAWFAIVVLGGAAGMLPVVKLLTPGLGRPRDVSIVAKCQSNLRQIGMAAMIYAIENGDRFPDDITGLLTEDIDPHAFVCPASNDIAAVPGPTTQATAANVEAGGHLSYVYIGKGWTRQTATVKVVIAYEPLSNHGNSGMNVLYGDGHVEWFTAPEAQRIISEINSGHNPPRELPSH